MYGMNALRRLVDTVSTRTRKAPSPASVNEDVDPKALNSPTEPWAVQSGRKCAEADSLIWELRFPSGKR